MIAQNHSSSLHKQIRNVSILNIGPYVASVFSNRCQTTLLSTACYFCVFRPPLACSYRHPPPRLASPSDTPFAPVLLIFLRALPAAVPAVGAVAWHPTQHLVACASFGGDHPLVFYERAAEAAAVLGGGGSSRI
jgi:hypothetical protein